MRNFVELTVYEAVGFNTSYTYPFTAGFGGKNIMVSEFTTPRYPEVTAKITTGLSPRKQEFWVGGMSFDEIVEAINGSVQEADFILSYGNITFDDYRVYGSEITYAGNLVIDSTGAVSNKIALVYHNDTIIPTASVIGGGVSITYAGTYILATDNEIWITPTFTGETLTSILVEFKNIA